MSHILKEVIKNVSIDCVIFGFEKSSLEVLLIKRARKPFSGQWALPGGFIKKGELIEDAAKRILKNSTGIEKLYLEEIGVFDEVDRYPFWRVFTFAHFALIRPEQYKLSAGNDSVDVKWVKIEDLPDLPFDHQHIIATALRKLRSRIKHRPVGFELLPAKFTLPQLQALYETILGKKLDKRNFRKKIIKTDLLKKLPEKTKNNTKRAAYLYKFDVKNYNKQKNSGYMLELL